MNLLEQLNLNLPVKRTRQEKRHTIGVLVYITVLAVTLGARNIKQVQEWAETNMRTNQVKDLLGVIVLLVPSKATFSRGLQTVDIPKVTATLKAWIRFKKGKVTNIPKEDIPVGTNQAFESIYTLLEANKFITIPRMISIYNDREHKDETLDALAKVFQ